MIEEGRTRQGNEALNPLSLTAHPPKTTNNVPVTGIAIQSEIQETQEYTQQYLSTVASFIFMLVVLSAIVAVITRSHFEPGS